MGTGQALDKGGWKNRQDTQRTVGAQSMAAIAAVTVNCHHYSYPKPNQCTSGPEVTSLGPLSQAWCSP